MPNDINKPRRPSQRVLRAQLDKAEAKRKAAGIAYDLAVLRSEATTDYGEIYIADKRREAARLAWNAAHSAYKQAREAYSATVKAAVYGVPYADSAEYAAIHSHWHGVLLPARKRWAGLGDNPLQSDIIDAWHAMVWAEAQNKIFWAAHEKRYPPRQPAVRVRRTRYKSKTITRGGVKYPVRELSQ